MKRGGTRDDLLLDAVRKSSSAWHELRHAENLLERYTGSGGADRRHGVVLKHFAAAKASLRAAYNALVPRHKRRALHRPIRDEQLWRCRYCKGLVWEGKRRAHLEYAECLPHHQLWSDDQLTAHFEPAVRPSATQGVLEDD